MARGPRKHLKRLNAPKHWMLDKLGGIYAPRPSTGPHKLRECLPISLILRNRLKYALTRREVVMISMRRHVKVDDKVRTDPTYPAGFMDVVQIGKTKESYRLLYDVKRRFALHRITEEEAGYKLCRIVKRSIGAKCSIGRNPLVKGILGSIPFVVTHDGRTLKYPDPLVSVNDTVKLDLKTGKIAGHIKFETGNVCMITKGANQGRIGLVNHVEKHPGSFQIVHIVDKRGQTFSTRSSNVFVIGKGDQPWVSIPRNKGIKLNIIEEKEKNKKYTKA